MEIQNQQSNNDIKEDTNQVLEKLKRFAENKLILLGKWDEWKNKKIGEKKSIHPQTIEDIERLSKEGWVAQGKKPIEPGWPTTQNYSYNNPKVLNHTGNIGMLCGNGIIALDCDHPELIDWAEENLPKTYTQQGREDRRTYFFRCDEIKKIPLVKKVGNVVIHYGELQGEGSQVVIPPSIHPLGIPYKVLRDLNITFLEKKYVDELKEKFLDKSISTALKAKESSGKISPIETKLNLINIFSRKIPELKDYENDVWIGPHPIHGSETGTNLRLDLKNNIWHCWRCGSGGGVASAIALIDLGIPCLEVKGALNKEVYPKVLKVAEAIYEYKEVKSKNILLESNIDKALDEFYSDWEEMSEKFCKINPIYYDSHKIFWIWDTKKFKWVMTDETDLMNLIMESLSKKHSSATYASDVKNQILEGLRRVGRKHTPVPIKNTWIQFYNKVVDIETNKQFDATPEWFFTNPIPWELGETEEIPIMDKLFVEWVGAKSLKTLYEYLAYCAYSHMRIHRIFCFIGSGRNGKGQFNKVVRKYVGEDNVTTIDLDLIHSRFEGASLYKKLVCYIGEIDKGIFKKTRGLKALSGDDLVRAEFKGKDKFDFTNYAKPIIATNHLPETDDRTDGFFSRWSIAKFYNRFPEGKDIYEIIPDTEYRNFAKKSLGILRELFERGYFVEDGTIEDRRSKYDEVSSPFKEFLDENCVLEVSLSTKYSILYYKYCEWLKQKNCRNISTKEFSVILKRNNLEVKRVTIPKYGKQTTEIRVFGVKLEELESDESEGEEQEAIVLQNL